MQRGHWLGLSVPREGSHGSVYAVPVTPKTQVLLSIASLLSHWGQRLTVPRPNI